MITLLSQVFDSKVVRAFEAEKTRVTLAIEGFKQVVSVALAKADLNKTAITATVSANEGTVKVFQAEIEGQVAPMKAISESNQAQATAYTAAIQGAVADLNAQIMPEELKIQGIEANAKILGIKGELAVKEAQIAIETSLRELTVTISTMQSMAQGAQQIVASALNGVSSGANFNWSGSASTSYGGV
jgi:hypothetical protein